MRTIEYDCYLGLVIKPALARCQFSCSTAPDHGYFVSYAGIITSVNK